VVKKFAIFVATTGGPIQIERLTEERAPQSMICISGSTTILPISKEYHDFVRRGSGIIEREFDLIDKISFRADVSGMIDAGKSWQLGFFLAHAVVASQEANLVDNLNDADHVIWATGCVDYDLNVLKVEHLIEKLKTSADLFTNLELEKTPKTVIFPGSQSDNIDDVNSTAGTAEIYKVDKLYSLLNHLNLGSKSKPLKAKSANNDLSPVSSQRRLTLVAMSIIIIGFLSVWFYREWPVQDFNNVKPQATEKIIKEKPLKSSTALIKNRVSKPVDSAIEKENIKLFTLRPPNGKSCIDVIFSGAEPKKVAISYDKPERLDKVCRLLFEFYPQRNKYIAAWLNKVSGRYIRYQKKPEALSGSKIFDITQSWSIEIPRKMKDPFHYRLIVLSGDKPLSDDLKWLRRQPDIDVAQKELTANGVHTTKLSLKVNP